jgi:hypothetical protein
MVVLYSWQIDDGMEERVKLVSHRFALARASSPNQAPTGSTDKLSNNYSVAFDPGLIPSVPTESSSTRTSSTHISLRSIFPIISRSFHASFYLF